ncbi:MAG: PAS domain S-box protein [Acetobacteraceae bacterium]|nr:PAS domain S-box protein [Acetobacteraceae bacterium]
MAENLDPRDRADDRRRLLQLAAALSDGVILVEPDQTIAWANDAALKMHGVGAVADLGRTVSEYRERFGLQWRGHHRPPPGPHPMERVLAGEAFDGIVVEAAPAGQEKPGWTRRIRGVALTDAEGRPDCLALVFGDGAGRSDAEERFERAFAANPAPAVVLRLSDLRYVRANRGFLELTGYAEEEVVGRSTQELDVLEGAKQRELAMERLCEHRTIPQMEAWPRLPDRTPKLVLVAGQPVELGDDAYMLLTFADLEPRRQVEAELRLSEERFEKAFRLAPVPMAVAQLDDWFRFVLVNGAFERATGYGEKEAVGRTAAELGLWLEPGAAGRLERALSRAGSARDVEVRLRAKDGVLLDCLLSAEAVTIHDRPCALWAMQDVTERRRTEAELAAAIDAVMRETSWFSRTVLEKLAQLRRPADRPETEASGIADLTRRGHEVLGLVCRGLDDGAIAERLGLSRTTVRNHVNALDRSTGARGRTALVVWARERGFAGPEPGGAKRKRRNPH